MHDERSPYYYLPGGRVQINETAEDAMIREIREELEIDINIIRPLWFNQGFFCEDVSNENYHEICTLIENKHKHVYEWLEFGKLEKEYFYPIFLKEAIFNLPEYMQIISNYD